jgi:hypothetical protein
MSTAGLLVATALGCTGSEWFRYQRETPNVEIDVKVNHPPVITLVVVAPLETDVGDWISLNATADDPDGEEVDYLWTSTGGAIEKPHLRETRLTCTRPGLWELTLTVKDRAGAKQTMNVRFNCD